LTNIRHGEVQGTVSVKITHSGRVAPEVPSGIGDLRLKSSVSVAQQHTNGSGDAIEIGAVSIHHDDVEFAVAVEVRHRRGTGEKAIGQVTYRRLKGAIPFSQQDADAARVHTVQVGTRSLQRPDHRQVRFSVVIEVRHHREAGQKAWIEEQGRLEGPVALPQQNGHTAVLTEFIATAHHQVRFAIAIEVPGSERLDSESYYLGNRTGVKAQRRLKGTVAIPEQQLVGGNQVRFAISVEVGSEHEIAGGGIAGRSPKSPLSVPQQDNHGPGTRFRKIRLAGIRDGEIGSAIAVHVA
jgi:hypothetical protein